jgi:hypothetical protein
VGTIEKFCIYKLIKKGIHLNDKEAVLTDTVFCALFSNITPEN